MLEYNDQYIPQDTSPFSRQYPEAQPLGVLHGQIPSPNAGLTMEGDLNESLAGLGLNGNDGFHDSEVQNSILGRTRNIGTSAVLTQRLPETINPMLVCETPYHSTRELVRSHISNSRVFLTRTQLELILSSHPLYYPTALSLFQVGFI